MKNKSDKPGRKVIDNGDHDEYEFKTRFLIKSLGRYFFGQDWASGTVIWTRIKWKAHRFHTQKDADMVAMTLGQGSVVKTIDNL